MACRDEHISHSQSEERLVRYYRCSLWEGVTLEHVWEALFVVVLLSEVRFRVACKHRHESERSEAVTCWRHSSSTWAAINNNTQRLDIHAVIKTEKILIFK
jgi:hypothetical protein